MEDGAALEIDGQFSLLFDQATVGHIATGDEVAGQINDVAGTQFGEVFVLDRRGQDLLAHSEAPSCERIW